ncbi:MAG: hypothetical protein R3B09_21770 [Nannocystaceae bacterium]
MGELVIEERARSPDVEGLGLAGGLRAAAGEAEVHHPHPAVVAEHDVLGLDVAVDEPRGVGRREAAAGVEHHRQRLAPADPLIEAGLEGDALDVLHRHPHPALIGAHVVDGDHVGVGEAGHRLGLAEHPGAEVVARLRGRQELERDLPIELRIVAGVDDPDRAAADRPEDDVAAEGHPGREAGGLVVDLAQGRRDRVQGVPEVAGVEGRVEGASGVHDGGGRPGYRRWGRETRGEGPRIKPVP